MSTAARKRRLGTVIAAIAVTVAIGCSACLPVVPGKVVALGLGLADSFVLDDCVSDRFTAFPFGDDLWIIGRDQMVRRLPTGAREVSKVPMDPEGIKLKLKPDRFYILEPRAGRARCFSGEGKVLWSAEGLGTVNDVIWTGDTVWALSYPDPLTEPKVVNVVLHRIRLSDGRLVSDEIELPQGVHWKSFSSAYGESSAKLMKTGETVCVKYVAYENSTGFSVPFLAVPSESGFRAVLRDSAASAAVVGDILVGVTWQRQYVLVAYDLQSGNMLWNLELEPGDQLPFVTLAGDVIVLCDQGGEQHRIRGLNPRTGEVLWSTGAPWVPDGSFTLTRDVVLTRGDSALRLSPTGEIRWSLQLGALFEVISYDESRDQMTVVVDLLAGVDEATIRLSDGVIVDYVHGQASYRYMSLNHLSVPVIKRTAGTSWEVLQYLEGRSAHIADPIRQKQDGGVFARTDFVVTACTVGYCQVNFYILKPKGSIR